MALSLYQATIPSYLQILGAVSGLIDKAEAHCTANSVSPETLIQARFADDMAPFAYQITSVVHHSKGAIEGVNEGVFSPDRTPPPETFGELRDKVAGAITFLEGLDEATVNGFIGQPMRFEMGDYKVKFVAENFLLSFSQPNFYFHATTAYDLLRANGLKIGKGDFMGAMRREA